MKSKIETVQDAFALLGRDYNALPEVSMLPEDLGSFLTNTYLLATVIEAKNYEANDNKPWIPDYTNWEEDKYEPSMYMGKDSSGSGFSYYVYDGWSTDSGSGSRFCFINYEVMKDVTTSPVFVELYKKVFLR